MTTTVALRITVRVKPGASRPQVGGAYGSGELIVAVHERAVDGAATAAVLRAVASALGVRPDAVSLVSGHTSRSKVVAVTVAHDQVDAVRTRLAQLLG